MASGRQRKKIAQKKKKKKKKRKATSTTAKKKIFKKNRTTAAQGSCTRTAIENPKRQDSTVVEAAAPIKEQDKEKSDSQYLRPRVNSRCGVCGAGRSHDSAPFCPYSYINGQYGLGTCREVCRPGRHRPLHELGSYSGSGGNIHPLGRVVRVNNVPLTPNEIPPDQRELRGLFGRFGPLVDCHLTRTSVQDLVGFGFVAFESCEHAREAVDKLNGHQFGDRRLRVDWAYPRAARL